MTPAFGQHNHELTEAEEIKARMEEEIRGHRLWYTSQGILFIIFGIFAAALPSVIAISIELLIGVILIMSGVMQLIISFRSQMHWWALLSGLLSISIGALMLWKPFAGLSAMIFIIAAFLMLEGIFELFLASKFFPLENWGWMMFSGLIAITLSILIFFGFPTLGIYYIGYIIALNLVLYGTSLLMLIYSIG